MRRPATRPHARAGVLRALSRHQVREFNSDRKPDHCHSVSFSSDRRRECNRPVHRRINLLRRSQVLARRGRQRRRMADDVRLSDFEGLTYVRSVVTAAPIQADWQSQK